MDEISRTEDKLLCADCLKVFTPYFNPMIKMLYLLLIEL